MLRHINAEALSSGISGLLGGPREKIGLTTWKVSQGSSPSGARHRQAKSSDFQTPTESQACSPTPRTYSSVYAYAWYEVRRLYKLISTPLKVIVESTSRRYESQIPPQIGN